jgi:hypothetical protein
LVAELSTINKLVTGLLFKASSSKFRGLSDWLVWSAPFDFAALWRKVTGSAVYQTIALSSASCVAGGRLVDSRLRRKATARHTARLIS